MQFTLAVTSICFAPKYAGNPEFAIEAFDSWEQHWATRGLDAHGVTQACRMRVLTLNGQLRSALATGSRVEGQHDLNAEWLAAPARTFEALIRVQKGQFQEALTLAETTRKIILLHEISPTISGDLEGFIIFVAHWARGTTISARHTLEQVAAPARADLHAVHSHTGLIDLSIVLFLSLIHISVTPLRPRRPFVPVVRLESRPTQNIREKYVTSAACPAPKRSCESCSSTCAIAEHERRSQTGARNWGVQ